MVAYEEEEVFPPRSDSTTVTLPSVYPLPPPPPAFAFLAASPPYAPAPPPPTKDPPTALLLSPPLLRYPKVLVEVLDPEALYPL